MYDAQEEMLPSYRSFSLVPQFSSLKIHKNIRRICLGAAPFSHIPKDFKAMI